MLLAKDEKPLLKLRKRKLRLKKESVIPNVEGVSTEAGNDILKGISLYDLIFHDLGASSNLIIDGLQ